MYMERKKNKFKEQQTQLKLRLGCELFVARVELGFAALKINLGDNFIPKWCTIQPFEAYSLKPL
jgi:hypothetical protein